MGVKSENTSVSPKGPGVKNNNNGSIGTPETGDPTEPDLQCQEFDDVLEIVGPQGKYQKLLLYAVVCPITAIEPFITLNTVFLLFQPDHWCYVPGRDNATDIETWKTLHIPPDLSREGHFSQCSMYAPNNSIVPCQMGFEYNKLEYESTIASAFNWVRYLTEWGIVMGICTGENKLKSLTENSNETSLQAYAVISCIILSKVCEDNENPMNAFTAQALGNAVGTLIFGHLADKIGRKPIFFITILINIVFRLISFLVVHNISLFLLMQFVVGSGFPLMFIAPSMIVAEICDKDYRGWVYAVTWMIWVVGMAALPLVVWACREWLIIGLATSLPGVVLFGYWFHLPESPRWLFSRGLLDKSCEVLMQIAKCNGKQGTFSKSELDNALQRLYNLQSKNEGTTGVWSLFGRKRLAKNTMLLTVCWSINLVVYYGLTLNTTHMSGNQFVNFFLLSIIELPSGMAGAYLVDRVGRRWTQVVFFGGAFTACAAAACVLQYLNEPILEIISVVFAKFAITLTFLVVYLQGAEIFPTPLRSTGSGFASTVGAACGIVGPMMVALGTYHLSYPYWIMGSLCFLGMISAAFLPETLKQNLPESIEDADNFGKGNKFWSLYPKPVPRGGSVEVIDLPAPNHSHNHLKKTEISSRL